MTIVAWGGFGGRVDQSFHSVHALFYDRYENNPAASVAAAAAAAGAKRVDAPKRHIFILSSISVTFLLFPGLNVISTPHRVLGKTCGIIPCGQPARITTKGLEWDLEDAETRFGGLVSTSNHLKEQEVRIWTDVEVVFTAEVRGGEEGEGRGR